ncbi:MAG: hypothetical protein GVY13_13295 [Alphaproteobacteria bacterium]|jgi:hypothetical protein|nr:hypothetical protein [Alphaproteobacteria bacterium]
MLSAGLILLAVAGCIRVNVSPIPGVAVGFGLPLGAGGGFGNPAMRVGEPGWLVGIWAPAGSGCGRGDDVLFDANGDYRSPERAGRWYLIDTTLTVRGAPVPQPGPGQTSQPQPSGQPGQPSDAQPTSVTPSYARPSAQPSYAQPAQPVFGPQTEVSWQIVDAAPDRVTLQAPDGTVTMLQRCAGASGTPSGAAASGFGY